MQPQGDNQTGQGYQQGMQPGPAVNAFQSSVPHPATPMLSPADVALLQKSGGGGSRLKGLVITGLLITLLLSVSGFAIWAFISRQDYKNNSDAKSAVAVEEAKVAQKAELDLAYAEKDKSPYTSYVGKPEAGSLNIQYPRTWSAYIEEQTSGSNPVVGYFHPGFVPDKNGNTTSYAMRLEVVNTIYADVLRQYQNQAEQGTVTVAPYTFTKVPGQLGSIITGEILQGRQGLQGTMIIMPIRDKTLKIWTESNTAFGKDFRDGVLPNLTYVP